MPSNIYIGTNVSDMFVGKKQTAISKVVCDCGNDVTITAGDDTGSSIAVECEWGSQENVSAMLESLKGFKFLPYSAQSALINPAFEIGDAVSIRGYYSGIWNVDVTYGPVLTADLKAGDEELDHEYPVPTEKKRTVSKRDLAKGSVSIGGGGIKSGTVEQTSLTETLQKAIEDSKKAVDVVVNGSSRAASISAVNVSCDNLLFNKKIFYGTDQLGVVQVTTSSGTYRIIGARVY